MTGYSKWKWGKMWDETLQGCRKFQTLEKEGFCIVSLDLVKIIYVYLYTCQRIFILTVNTHKSKFKVFCLLKWHNFIYPFTF